MKKIILIFILPLTLLMAEMTLTGTQLSITSEQPTPPSGNENSSSYLEAVMPPECSANNPEVQFISSNADWSKINDGDKRIFCVKPGNYKALGYVKLRTSGTKSQPRYILLDNGNDTHPGKLAEANIAKVQLSFNNADYWVVDRMAVTGLTGNKEGDRPIAFYDGSSFNIINRHFVSDYTIGIAITDNCHNNTIQNSRIQDMTLTGVNSDRVALELKFKTSYTNNINIYNTKILNNEIRNANDGLQLVRHYSSTSTYQHANYKGTIIDSNRMWSEVAYSSNRTSQYPENSIDIKVGSDDPENPVIVSNNYFWGYSVIFPIHYGVKNLIIDGNVFLECQRAIAAGDSQNFPYALSDSVIKNNIFYKMGSFNPKGLDDTPYGIYTSETNNINISKNIFIGGSNASPVKPKGSNTNYIFKDNSMISSSMSYSPPSGSIKAPNFYYNTSPGSFTDGSNSVHSNADDANMNNLTFDYDIYTNNPKQKAYSRI